MKTEIMDGLKKYIAQNIMKQSKRELKEDEPLISSGIVDSFSLVDLALFIEDTYGVQIDDAELNADVFDTLGQLADLVISKK